MKKPSKKEILSAVKVGDLFTNDLAVCRNEYKELLKLYHPDSASGNSEVFLKVKAMYEKAIKLFDAGEWEENNYIQFSASTGKKVCIKYLEFFTFELGECYICKEHIVYHILKEKKKYYENYVKQVEYAIKRIKNIGGKIEEQFLMLLPNIFSKNELKDGGHILALKKEENVLNLKTVQSYFEGKIDDRHVAWMISRLHNLCCLFKKIGIVHNGICLENCFVDPENHTILLLGGWWYTTCEFEPMIGISKEIYNLIPVKNKTTKKSVSTTDIESVKYCGMNLLGEKNCGRFAVSDLAPKPVVEYLCSGSSEDSFRAFSLWEEAMIKAYGKRRFIEMTIDRNKLYK